MTKFDALIIGSGQGGNPLASRLAGEGKQVAIVERGPLGGTCVNTGCTPTKAMIGSSQVAHYARESARWGVHAGQVSVSLAEILERKDRIVAQSRSSWEKQFEHSPNLRLYRGSAAFTGPRQIVVGDETLAADHVFIDTGTEPAIPHIPGLDRVRHLTSDDLIKLRELPRHLIVIGGGYVGLEFAQMFRRFGSDVTVIQHAAQILPREDSDVIEELMRALEAEGIQFRCDAKATRINEKDGGIWLELQGGDVVNGSHLLVATGRTPNTKDLQLHKTGVAMDEKGFIHVDEKLQTTAEGIWALGDVNGGPQFTHIAYNDYQIVYANIYQDGSLSARDRLVPYAVYTDPTLGRVGITEREARARGLKIKIGKKPVSSVARAIERGETSGLMKIVVDAETDLILGAAILSPEGGELVQILSTVMLAKQPYTLLKGAIYIHPTLAEGLFGLMENVK